MNTSKINIINNREIPSLIVDKEAHIFYIILFDNNGNELGKASGRSTLEALNNFNNLSA
jgi:hypothetical protein